MANVGMDMHVLKGGIELTLKDRLQQLGLCHLLLEVKEACEVTTLTDPGSFDSTIRVTVHYTATARVRKEIIVSNINQHLYTGILKDITRDVVEECLPYFLMTAVKQDNKNGINAGR